MSRQKRYEEWFRGCLTGLAVGDALGMPVETMTHEAIMQLNGGNGVMGYMDPVQTRIHDTVGLPAGSTTDDTQLAFSLARSIIDSEGLSLTDIGQKLVAEYRSSKFGWGGTTTRAAQGLAEYFDSGGKSGRSPLVYLTKHTGFDDKRCGNGVAMRIAPYALWHGTCGHRVDELVDQVFMIGRQTHDDPRASIGAVAVAAAIAHLLYHGHSTGGHDWFLRKSVLDAVRHAEEKFVDGKKVFSSVLEHAYALVGSPTLLREEIGNRSFTLESVPFAIATFLRHPTNFRAGVLEAVNAGGDADTTAAIVGAMIGTNIGVSGIPQEWRDGVVSSAGDSVALADALHAMCIRTAHPHR
jgi:ADP-ribosylglycohydrolase